MAEDTLIETMKHLGIEHDDAADSVKMIRVKDIADFFGQFADGMGTLQRVASKLPRADRVNGVLEYVNTRKKFNDLDKEIQSESTVLQTKREEYDGLRGILMNFE